jgi:tRNA (cmo5U34)-methyltransferase
MNQADDVGMNGSQGHPPCGDVGDGLTAPDARWSFGGQTYRTFDRHVARSVPLYKIGHRLILELSDFFLDRRSTCYDLGCSTGTLIRKLAHRHQGRDIRFVGVDIESEMISFARFRRGRDLGVEYLTAAIEDIAFEPVDLVVIYYTMQFIAPKHRQGIYDRVHRALNPGGAMILFEKVYAETAQLQDIFGQLLVDRKLAKGFTPEQIINKSRSLKGVMRPASTSSNLQSLAQAGFAITETFIKYLNFEGILAIK